MTIACVSNEVGGDLVGNAKWTGVRLPDVLDMAGVQAGRDPDRRPARSTAARPASRPRGSMDPARDADDRRRDERRSRCRAEHGFPARLIVPGLYGYVSATKWLAELELTTLEAFDAYWVPRGWAKEAPILTQSRIDVPRDGAAWRRAASPVAGVAWAPDRGISKVEVAVDGGDWQHGDARHADLGRRRGSSGSRLGRGARRPHARGPRDRRHGRGPDGRRNAAAPDGARGYHPIAVQVGERPAARAVRRRWSDGASDPHPVHSQAMTRRLFLFDTPDRFVAGTVGEPGNRDVLPPGP